MIEQLFGARMSPLKIGDFDVHRVIETEGPFAPVSMLLPGVDMARLEAQAHWLRPQFLSADNLAVMSFHSHVLRTGRHNVLIDACVGNDKERPLRASWHHQQFGYLHALAQAGLQPQDIDFVCCTHLHADHVGWNTQLRDGRWVPTFPKARYVFGKTEYTHWEAAHRQAVAEGAAVPNHGSFADSVLPVMDAGQAELVNEDFEFEEGVALQHAPGHTPGTCCVHVHSRGQRGIFSGDILHTPVQLVDTTLNSRFCHDPAQAVATRQRLVESVADTSTLLMTGHFPHSTGGRVVSTDSGLAWQGVS